MASLAQVSFGGETANETQKSYVANDITSFFSPDRASDYYAYSTRREDTAMLFEEALMSHRYGILRDVAITDKPDNPTASSITVDWGQRGRIGDEKLQRRAAFVIDQMMPELNGLSLVSGLPNPIEMNQGQSWSDNLAISPNISPSNSRVQTLQQSAKFRSSFPDLRFSGDRHKQAVE
ncbi:hypothetical protein TUM4438_42650 [Shewanella sairae]|uniref:Uncharacterized protein n=1 Tax=Shewanella sairae TaxID=190310 RepID=A0ABQ4PR81_9GAMM|nr:hypothetical protein [Shewanella sairae]GIU51792.1 hypothetical protein TUM4438_42650 [Shewanella sairae]